MGTNCILWDLVTFQFQKKIYKSRMTKCILWDLVRFQFQKKKIYKSRMSCCLPSITIVVLVTCIRFRGCHLPKRGNPAVLTRPIYLATFSDKIFFQTKSRMTKSILWDLVRFQFQKKITSQG